MNPDVIEFRTITDKINVSSSSTNFESQNSHLTNATFDQLHHITIINIILTIHINQMLYEVQSLLCHVTETTYRNTVNATDSFTSLTGRNGATIGCGNYGKNYWRSI